MVPFTFAGMNLLSRFDGRIETYRRWRSLVTDVVQANGISCLVEPTIPRDKRYKDDEWDVIDNQLLRVLKISLSEEVRDSIIGQSYNSTIKFLSAMDKIYNLATTATKFKLLADLMSFQQNGRSVSVITNEFKAMLSNLKSTKFSLDDLYTLMYLNGLDSDYDIIRQVIQASDKIPTLNDVINRIQGRESEICISNNHDNVALSLESSNNRRRRKVCTNCHRAGHEVKDCYSDGGGAVSRRPSWWMTRSRQTTPNHLENNIMKDEMQNNGI